MIGQVSVDRSRPDSNDASNDRPGSPSRRLKDSGRSARIADHFVPALASENGLWVASWNDHVVSVIGESADAVGDEQTKPPITKSQSAHPKRDRGLENDKSKVRSAPCMGFLPSARELQDGRP